MRMILLRSTEFGRICPFSRPNCDFDKRLFYRRRTTLRFRTAKTLMRHGCRWRPVEKVTQLSQWIAVRGSIRLASVEAGRAAWYRANQINELVSLEHPIGDLVGAPCADAADGRLVRSYASPRSRAATTDKSRPDANINRRGSGAVILEEFPINNIGTMQAFAFNIRRQKFQDPRVRRAINTSRNAYSNAENPGQSTHPRSAEFSRLGFCAQRQGGVGGTGLAVLPGLLENSRIRLSFGHKLHLRLCGRSERLAATAFHQTQVTPWFMRTI